jgi:hypothetical protein
MHILILASTANAAEKMQAALSSIVHRCSVAETWTDVLTSLESDRPDLVLVERGSLGQTETKSVGVPFASNLSVEKCNPAAVAGLHAFPMPRGYYFFFFGVLGFAGFFFSCGFAGFLAISPPPFQTDVARGPS